MPEAIDEPLVGDVVVGQPAEKAGLLPGDRIVKINEKDLKTWADLSDTIAASQGEVMNIVIERRLESGETQTLSRQIQASNEATELDVVEGTDEEPRYRIGVRYAVDYRSAGFGESVVQGFLYTAHLTRATIVGIGAMITGRISAKHISGPIGIAREVMKSAERGIANILGITIFLSVSLAVLNLLPIPILDGGHLLFFVLELIKGGRLSLRAHEIANQLGMALLLLLMVFAVGNDLLRLITGAPAVG